MKYSVHFLCIAKFESREKYLFIKNTYVFWTGQSKRKYLIMPKLFH